MPYSFTQIEKDKSRTIGMVFAFLVLFYFLAGWTIALVVKNYFFFESSDEVQFRGFAGLSLTETLTALGIAFGVGWLHWTYSVHDLVPRSLRVLKAEPLSPNDTYHQMLQNIIEEVSVATGGEKIEGVVVPTMAMNAFALSDFSGRKVIGVTEGLLARLSRAQLEAVIGHEAAHIVSEDCLSTTVTTSLFALVNGMLNGISQMFRYRRSRDRDSLGGFITVIFLILMVTRFISLLFRMFISRQREFRADAMAVRLTRDPLSLAQALYAISQRWRGAGLAGEELEAIFITNPKLSALDESEGLWADLFSTHPPIRQRLKVLLDLAKADVQQLEDNFRAQLNRPRQDISSTPAPDPREWMLNREGQWIGPYSLIQIATQDWVTPETWVKKANGSVVQVFDDPAILELLRQKNQAQNKLNGQGQVALDGFNLCLRCRLPLSDMHYEGTIIKKCSTCGGALVKENDVQRIIIREDVSFSDRVKRMAELTAQSMKNWEPAQTDLKTAQLYKCPTCPHPKPTMIRMFYTLAYPVEVDKCLYCGQMWFDQDELEILQCLIEKNTKQGSLE